MDQQTLSIGPEASMTSPNMIESNNQHPFAAGEAGDTTNIIDKDIITITKSCNGSLISSAPDAAAAAAGTPSSAPDAAAAAGAATAPSKFKRMCVFCGSKSGKKAVFSQAALQLGQELVDRKMELVYGGGGIGLMGLISRTVFEGGCRVLGVIPKALVSHQIAGDAIGELIVVADMHERKAEMARQADAFIAMPGGYGTLEELLEMITWSQLGIHDKPVGLLNVDGYYDSLLKLFDNSVEEGFMKAGHRQIVISAPTPKSLLDKMQAYEPIHDIVASRQSWEIEQLGCFST